MQVHTLFHPERKKTFVNCVSVMEVTTAVNLSQKERVLSPKRKSNFAGELVMLNEGKPDLIPSNNR